MLNNSLVDNALPPPGRGGDRGVQIITLAVLEPTKYESGLHSLDAFDQLPGNNPSAVDLNLGALAQNHLPG